MVKPSLLVLIWMSLEAIVLEICVGTTGGAQNTSDSSHPARGGEVVVKTLKHT